MAATIGVQELLYEETFQTTGVVDFGIDLASALSGAKPIPPEGLRLNVSFEGELKGPRLRGRIAGTDYILMRGDGLPQLDIHAVITTDDGARIAFHGQGVAIGGGPTLGLRYSVRLQTAAPAYAWVNRLLVWATGESNPATGFATLKGYAA